MATLTKEPPQKKIASPTSQESALDTTPKKNIENPEEISKTYTYERYLSISKTLNESQPSNKTSVQSSSGIL